MSECRVGFYNFVWTILTSKVMDYRLHGWGIGSFLFILTSNTASVPTQSAI